MSKQSDKKICKTHNFQIIATDLKESCNEESRYLCGQCLTQKTMETTILINEEAQNYLDDVKTNYQQLKSKNIEKSQKILSQLQSCNDELKRNLLQICEKISQQIIQENDRLSILSENLNQTIQSIDIYNFIELFPQLQNQDFESSKNAFKSILQPQILQIQNNHKIEEFNTLLNSLEIQTSQLQFYQTEHKQEIQDDNHIDTPGLKINCQSHNKEIIAFDLDPERAKENRLACIYCIEEFPIKYVSLKKVQSQWNQLEESKKKRFEQIQQKTYENQQVINQQLKFFTDIWKQKNEEIQDHLNQHQLIINNLINQACHGMNQDWQNYEKETLFDIIETLSIIQQNKEASQTKQEIEIVKQDQKLNKYIFNSIQKVKETFLLLLQKISEKIQSDLDIFSNNPIKLQNIELNLQEKEIDMSLQIFKGMDLLQQEIKETQTEMLQFQGQINYLMLQNQAIKQNDYFRVLSFTKEGDYLIAGCNKQVQIYKFCWGQLELIQQIDKHEYNICSLYVMKKSKNFVTGDFNGKIIFWAFEDNKGKYLYELKEHKDYVNQILMNINENEMITCSDDNTIKFYKKDKEQWKCTQTIQGHQHNVHAIALNPSENTLVSCGFDSIILIIVKDSVTEKWSIKQTIKNSQYGYRICFIKNNNILFQPQAQQKMWLFQKSIQSGDYEKTREFEVNKIQSSCSRWFQMEYQEQTKILLCKNGNCVNLFRVQDDYSLKAEQSIVFETFGISGAISNDFLHLVLWDEKSKQFQIRKQYYE